MMPKKLREMLNLPEMTDEQEMELLTNIASVPFSGGEMVVQKIGDMAGMQGATGEDLVRAAGQKLGADQMLSREALDTIAQTGGSVLEGIADPLNLASFGGAGLMKAGIKQAGKQLGKKTVSELPQLKRKAEVVQDKGGVKVLDSEPKEVFHTIMPEGATYDKREDYALKQAKQASAERDQKRVDLAQILKQEKEKQAKMFEQQKADEAAFQKKLDDPSAIIPLRDRIRGR